MNSMDLTKKAPKSFLVQFDYSGNFRIVHCPPGQPHFVASEWKPYNSIAVLRYENKVYIAGSAFGLLPEEATVYELTEAPTKIDNSKQWENSKGTDMHALRGCHACDHNEKCSYVGSTTQLNTLATMSK